MNKPIRIRITAIGVLVLSFFSVRMDVYAQDNSADQQANFLTRLFFDTCAKYPGQNAKVSASVKQNNFVRANDYFSKAVLQNQPGEVWGVPNHIGQFVVVLTGKYQCSVWARRAAAKLVNENFEKLIRGLPRPGLKVDLMIDKITDSKNGSFRQLGYFVQKDGASHGWLMLATTTESARAGVQAHLTISPATR